VILDQLTSLLPKDSEEVNAQVKHLHAMLNAAIMTDPTLGQGDRRRDQDPDHRQSPHGGSASRLSLTLNERGQGQGDRWDVIHNRDAHDQTDNRHQERDQLDRECHDERDRDFYCPYYDHPA
jgi:hypothetical protein